MSREVTQAEMELDQVSALQGVAEQKGEGPSTAPSLHASEKWQAPAFLGRYQVWG